MTRNRQQTASRIKQAAICLLKREGFAGWGINAVAREASVDKVLIYRYFESLSGLLSEIASETRFWPDPDSLSDSSAEAFITETIESQEVNGLARLLIALPDADVSFAMARDKFSIDLDEWIEGILNRCHGHIGEPQLMRLPAIILFQYISRKKQLTSTELWQQVSPPLEWVSEDSFQGFDELPTELL